MQDHQGRRNTAMPMRLGGNLQNVCPRFENGAQLCGSHDDYPLVLLCGGGATRNEKLAFVCQYADAYQQKVLLLDECGVIFPRHQAIHKKMCVAINRAAKKVGLIDVLRAAVFGKKAEHYAAAWCNGQALIDAGYQRVFIATDDSVNPCAHAAVVFPERNERKNMRLLQFLYDVDVVILGVAGKQGR